jgi:hypothetical protein
MKLPDGRDVKFPIVQMDDGAKAVDFSNLYEETGIRLAPSDMSELNNMVSNLK